MNMTWQREGFFRPKYFLKDGERLLFTLESIGGFFSPNRPWRMHNDSLNLEMKSGFSLERREIIDAGSHEPLAEASCGLQELLALRVAGQGSLGEVVTKEGDSFQLQLTARRHEGIKITAQSGPKSLCVELHGKSVTVTTNLDIGNRYAAALCLAVSSWLLFSRMALRHVAY